MTTTIDMLLTMNPAPAVRRARGGCRNHGRASVPLAKSQTLAKDDTQSSAPASS